MLRVEGAAAPVHAAEIAGKCNGSLHARRRKYPLRSQVSHLGTAGVPILRGQSPGVVRRQSLRRQRWRRKRERLRRRGFESIGVAFWNRTLFHAEHGLSGFPIQNKKIPGLVALDNDRRRDTVAAQRCEHWLGGSV